MIWWRESNDARAHSTSSGLPTVLVKPRTRSRTFEYTYDAFQVSFVLNCAGESPKRDLPALGAQIRAQLGHAREQWRHARIARRDRARRRDDAARLHEHRPAALVAEREPLQRVEVEVDEAATGSGSAST